MDLYNKIRNAILEGREQLDEVGDTPEGKRALGRYIKDRRATILGGGMGMQQQNQDRSTTDKQRKDLGRKVGNAFTGVSRAVDRLTKEETEGLEEKRGLWDNIHAKRNRIKHGSGERMRKPGSEGAPTSADFKASQNEEVEKIDEVLDTRKSQKSYQKAAKASRDKASDDFAYTRPSGRGSLTPPTKADQDRVVRYMSTWKKRTKGLDLVKNKLNKPLREEVEELDELSGATLGSYAVKSKKDETARKEHGIKVRDELRKATGRNFGTPIDRKLYSPTASRGAGQRTALKKLTGQAKVNATEEVENLDELSKKTLGSYIKKASPSASAALATAVSSSNPDSIKAAGKRFSKRSIGIDSAVNKLTKEEAEQIDEMKNVPTHKLQALVKRGESDEEGMSPAFGMQIKAARNELARRKKAGIKEESEIDEAVEVSHDLYVRSHGKKAKGTGGWAFGHSADAKSSDLHWTQGSKNFTDAAKSAKAWAKEKGHRKIYVMPESVEETEMDNIEEGRGRPPKEGSEAWKRAQTERKKDPAEHIINRMGQASTNMTGGQHITYDDGKTHRVTNTLAAKTLAHYRGLKPAQKADFQAKIAKSHQHHLDALAGK